MNLSHKLTFSLVFSILLVAGFALVPTVMAAEGGPTAIIEVDDSAIQGLDGNRDGDIDPTNDTGDANATPPVPADDTTTMVQTVDGTNVLMTNDARTFILNQADITGTAAGEFRVIVTFNQDVYRDSTVAEQTSDDPAVLPVGLGGGFRDDGATPPDTSLTFTAYPVDGGASFTLTGAVERVDTVPDVDGDTTTTGIQPHRRQFLITITVPEANADQAPFVVRINIPENAVYSKASAEQLVNGEIQDAVEAVGSQAASMDFTVVPKPLIRPTVVVSDTEIQLHQTATVTLTFTEAPTGTDMPRIRTNPTAEPGLMEPNIMVTNGSFLADDPNTADVDEGLTKNADGTVWTITVVPQAGMSADYELTVAAVTGAPFVLSEMIQVDVIPPTPTTPTNNITFTGNAPMDGAPFTVTITYTIAPDADLTAEGVTVTNATKGTFSGSDGTYTIMVDPNQPSVGSPVTVTVSVGQFSGSFTTNATPPPTVVDPNRAITITLAMGIEDGKYLVVGPNTTASGALPAVGVTAETKSDMPNLEALFFAGGTIDVYVNAGGNTAASIKINEIMWAVDEGEVGAAGYTHHQWIELYNNSSTDAAGGTITLRFKPAALDSDPTDLGTRTDRVSNVLKFDLLRTGWSIAGKGQNGNSTDGSLKEFISMSRKSPGNNGIHPDSWVQSTLLSHVNHKGTPGKANTRDAVSPSAEARPGLKADGSFDSGTFDKIVFWPPKNRVIINEVHNNSDDRYDWLELRFLESQNLENWTLSYVKSDLTEVEIMRFPKRSFAKGEILLIVNRGPRETNLAAGQDVTLGSANQQRGAGPHKYWNPSNGNSNSGHYLDIPDYNGGDFLLILRSAKGWERFGSRDRIHDVVGSGNFAHRTLSSSNPADVKREPHTKFAKSNGGDDKGYIWETDTWPLNGQARGKGISNRAPNAGGSNNGNSRLQDDRKLAVGTVWARNGTHHGFGKDGIYDPGFRGGLGYGRDVTAKGTPGYDNGVVKGKHTDLANGKLVISELMLTTDNGRFPQWIEIHNTSDNTVDLHANTDGNGPRNGWSIRVENHRSDSWDGRRRDRLNVEVRFNELGLRYIPANQTALIVADKVRNSKASYFPDHRVASIWQRANGYFKMENRRDVFLNLKGFRLELVDGNGQVSDAIGNLDGKGPDIYNPDNIDFDSPSDNGAWNWPAEDDMMVGTRRTSLIRIYDAGEARPATPEGPESMRGAIVPLGTNAKMLKMAMHAWVHASDTKMANTHITWYGSEDDHGTPLQTAGTPLPVELSFFRPTLEDGKVTIQWTTESELDNAGFNILRSDSSNGEFKQVNEQMIQGKGTTAERTTYKWVDTTAKPGVHYYYQIEDVSFAGERNMLATTKLKGLVSAKGKATTRWGELKNLR